MKALLLATTVIAGLAGPGTAFAQDVAADQAAETQANEGLAEIVVTAQRREQKLQRQKQQPKKQRKKSRRLSMMQLPQSETLLLPQPAHGFVPTE